MSWGGKGSGWQCTYCLYQNHYYSSAHCVECHVYTQNNEKGGYNPKGKGKQYKGDHPPYQGRGDYPPHTAQKAHKGQSDQKGKGKRGESAERKKLGQMRTMLKAAEAIPGWEDK
eukprot:6099556-Heterocapsa_arctica.AAC.1